MELTKTKYKQTEIGLIPEDWSVERLGEFSFITKLAGYEYSKHFNSYKDGGDIIVVRGTNITNNKLDLTDIRKIPRKTSEYLVRSKLNKGDLVFAYVGTIGPVFLIEDNDKYHLGPNTCKIVINKLNSNKFIYTYFNSRLIKNEISEHTSIGAQPSLSMEKIRNFKIILPPLPEQKAIAEVLSDVDSLIQAIEQKLAKKRAIKQGAMQKLLTPPSRTSGQGKEDWEVKKLGEFLDYEQPTPYIVKSVEYNDNYNTPVLTAGKSFILGYTNEEFGIFENEPVIIFDDFTTATKFVDFDFKVKSSAMKILKKKNDSVNIRFIYELMQLIVFPLGDHKRHWIGEYQHIDVSVPSQEEQTHIATILSDMDKEIELIEQQLAKYQVLKHGLMQELLTGRIRLTV